MNQEELFLLSMIAETELQILITKTVFGIVASAFLALFIVPCLIGVFINILETGSKI